MQIFENFRQNYLNSKDNTEIGVLSVEIKLFFVVSSVS